MSSVWSIVKGMFGQQDSKAGETNAKDLGHTVKVVAVGAALIGAKYFLTEMAKVNLGAFDKLIDTAIAAAVVWVEARQADNS